MLNSNTNLTNNNKHLNSNYYQLVGESNLESEMTKKINEVIEEKKNSIKENSVESKWSTIILVNTICILFLAALAGIGVLNAHARHQAKDPKPASYKESVNKSQGTHTVDLA